MRVAFVHDYLTQFGGAERVLVELLKLYPDAPLYTSLYRQRTVREHFTGIDVRTSFLQRIPGAVAHFRKLLPLYPAAFESFDLREYDLVISSSTAFAKGVRVAPATLHVAYINTPARFLWYPDEYTASVTPAPLKPALAVVLPALRRWDLAAAQRPRRLIANSEHVARRIKAIYGRESDVVPCPVDASEFSGAAEPVEDYFLVLTRLLPYKRVQLAIAACNALNARLVVAGAGPDERRLRALAGDTISFVGAVDDARRRQLIKRARAVVVPGTEDFGLVPLEASAAGRPTVAFAAGGALETVVEGATGIFFREPTVEALVQALHRVSDISFDPALMAEHVQRFSPGRFRQKLAALIERYLHETTNGGL